MTTSGSDPNEKPGPGDERDQPGSPASSGWQNPATGPGTPAPSGTGPSGSTAAGLSGGQSQPTGWERPTGPESGPSASETSPLAPSSQPPESSPAPSAQPSGPDWPTYPSPGTEPTRPLPPEQPYSAGPSTPPPDQTPPSTPYAAPYQPYDPQSMPGYGSSTSYPPAEAPPPSYPGVDQTGGGYGNNPYEVNPYQQGQYGGYVGYGPPPNHPQAVTAFVLGLVGLVVCTPVGIAGLVMGGRVRREIDAAPSQYSGRGLATAGWVMGIISVVILVVLVVIAIIGFSAGALGY